MGSPLGRRRLAGAYYVVRGLRHVFRLRGNGGGGKLPEPGGGFRLRNGGPRLMKREREEITLADILLCVLTWIALGLGLAWAF